MIKNECHLGCGQQGIRQTKYGNWICSNSANSCPALKKRNSEAVTKAHKDGKIPGWNDLSDKVNLNRGWSKGLTKDTDIRLNKLSQILKASPNTRGRSYKHTQETKEILSKKRVEYLENNSKHCDWYEVSGIKVQGKLELVFANFLVKHKIQFSRKRILYQEHRRYTPDFFLPDFNIYVEVKGFLYEKDKAKLNAILKEHEIDIRLAYKKDIDNLIHINDILALNKIERYHDVNMKLFTNHWNKP